ncbi:hypothetical protein VKT23_018098 [Stygiomarasmius scandens]|uniref:Uncharacterized protein n=1 Tax=Marasmiellus scandens TaxID=2682957 RepID=A0ABR1ISL3_9AGAR
MALPIPNPKLRLTTTFSTGPEDPLIARPEDPLAVCSVPSWSNASSYDEYYLGRTLPPMTSAMYLPYTQTCFHAHVNSSSLHHIDSPPAPVISQR